MLALAGAALIIVVGLGTAARLSRWCADEASVAPRRCGGREFELRRRPSLERVTGSLLTEDPGPAARARRGPDGRGTRA